MTYHIKGSFVVKKTNPGWMVFWPDDTTRAPAAFATWDEMIKWLQAMPRPGDHFDAGYVP